MTLHPGTTPEAVGVKPSEVLARAADLIEPEGAWTQDAFARNAAGENIAELVPSQDIVPVCFCLFGAVNAAAGLNPVSNNTGVRREPTKHILIATGHEALDPSFYASSWNDHPDRTQAEVVAALRKAADLAREAGQ